MWGNGGGIGGGNGGKVERWRFGYEGGGENGGGTRILGDPFKFRVTAWVWGLGWE